MTTPRYIRTPDGRLIVAPSPVPFPADVENEEPPEEEEGDSLSDLFALPKSDDMKDVVEVTDEDVIGGGDADMSDDLLDVEVGLDEEDEEDLFGVSEEDVMGRKPKPRKPKMRRTNKYYPTLPETIGGIG